MHVAGACACGLLRRCFAVTAGGEGWVMSRGPCVYMMATECNGTLYTGVTSSLAQRLQRRQGLTRGFTSRYGCKLLVWCGISRPDGRRHRTRETDQGRLARQENHGDPGDESRVEGPLRGSCLKSTSRSRWPSLRGPPGPKHFRARAMRPPDSPSSRDRTRGPALRSWIGGAMAWNDCPGVGAWPVGRR